jgi:sulfotransferase family protein
MGTGKASSRRAMGVRSSLGESEGRLPNFLIIGAMKSGTTSLQNALRYHPQAFCAVEPHFFCDHFHEGTSWYRKQFVGATDELAVGEKCADYLYLPKAIERMAATLPTARLIVALRDPVDRAYSHYWHERRERREHLSFAEALDAEPERLSLGDWGLGYTDMGRYVVQLARLASLYPRELIHVMLFEEFRSDPGRAFGSVCRFLGIDDTVRPIVLEKRHNPYRVERYHKPLVFLKRHRVFERLPRAISKRLRRALVRPAEYPPMEQEVRSRLEWQFAESNAALADWLGVTDLPWGSSSRGPAGR